MNRSLRSRLLIGLVATIVTGFMVAAGSIYALMRTSLLKEFDTLLGAKARSLATLIEQRPHDFEVEFADHPMQEFTTETRPEYFQIWDESDTVIEKSRHLGPANLRRGSGSLAVPGLQFVTLPDGRPGRQATVRFFPNIEENSHELAVDRLREVDRRWEKLDFHHRREVTLVVARETSEIDDALAQLGWLMGLVSAGVVTATLAVVAWLVQRSLAPLKALAVQIAALDDRELTARIQLDDAPSELDLVVAQLNAMIARLEASFHRERTFSADVAHELRTPVAGLRSTLEVALSKPRDSAEYRQSLEDCEAISIDTQHLVETLLSLARIDSGQARIERDEVDVQTLIESSWQPFECHAEEKQLQWSFRGSMPLVLMTDESKLRIVLANLLGNAVEYANRQGTVDVRWALAGQRLQLTVANSGCQLDENQIERVFDRFWRADAVRSATGSHSGLGLALSKTIVQLLGGTITVECRDAIFVVTLDLPGELAEPAGLPRQMANGLT